MIKFFNEWDEILNSEFGSPYYLKLKQFLLAEYRTHTIYPDMYDIYNAFKLTSYSDVKVVILGQDPYHNEGQAHGLSFSVKNPCPPPPSLVNIYKELKSDLGIDIPKSGDLTKWAKEGVLLLNTTLTVRAHMPLSHKGQGWETFTDSVIKKLSEREKPIVFILWGSNAIAKESLIDTNRHFVIKSPHPSPLSASRGFFGSKPFSRANEYLKSINVTPIDWTL